jgi:hypothetical protein
MIFSDDTGAAGHEGAKPDDDRPTTERFLMAYETAEKLGISAEAACALINAASKASLTKDKQPLSVPGFSARVLSGDPSALA